MDSTVVNAHYKKKVNAKMSLLNFKIILPKSLIKRFSSQNRKITAEEPQLRVELLQPLKELGHIVRFTEKRNVASTVSLMGKRMLIASLIVNPVMFCCVSRMREIASNCIIPFESNCTISQYADERLNF